MIHAETLVHTQEELGADYRTMELSLGHVTRGVEAHYNKSIQRDERIKVSVDWANILIKLIKKHESLILIKQKIRT